MGHRSTGTFRTLHALRIKGFATVSTLADMTGSPSRDVEAHLAHWSAAELVQFRETRALWQLTATGRALHLDLLREDVAPVVPNSDLAAAYGQFLAYNEQFKELCGAWQIFKFNGELNDHSDAGYDAAVLENLAHLHAAAEVPIAIASGALRHEILQILEAAALDQLFQTIVASGDTPESKPSPGPYLLAFEKLQQRAAETLEPRRCVAIEDSVWGLESARQAGLRCVGVTTSYAADELRGAELVVEGLHVLTLPMLDAVVRRGPG